MTTLNFQGCHYGQKPSLRLSLERNRQSDVVHPQFPQISPPPRGIANLPPNQLDMEKARKLGPIALIASIAATLVAVPIFSATSIINGVSIPASSNRFSMMSITGRSTRTAATDWHQLTPANPASGRSVTCRKVVVNQVEAITSALTSSKKGKL